MRLQNTLLSIDIAVFTIFLLLNATKARVVTQMIGDEDGCSIDQLCVCEDEWKNHGQYVRCVTAASEDFVYNGIITEEEKDEIVSERASSDCGK